MYVCVHITYICVLLFILRYCTRKSHRGIARIYIFSFYEETLAIRFTDAGRRGGAVRRLLWDLHVMSSSCMHYKPSYILLARICVYKFICEHAEHAHFRIIFEYEICAECVRAGWATTTTTATTNKTKTLKEIFDKLGIHLTLHTLS